MKASVCAIYFGLALTVLNVVAEAQGSEPVRCKNPQELYKAVEEDFTSYYQESKEYQLWRDNNIYAGQSRENEGATIYYLDKGKINIAELKKLEDEAKSLFPDAKFFKPILGINWATGIKLMNFLGVASTCGFTPDEELTSVPDR